MNPFASRGQESTATLNGVAGTGYGPTNDMGGLDPDTLAMEPVSVPTVPTTDIKLIVPDSKPHRVGVFVSLGIALANFVAAGVYFQLTGMLVLMGVFAVAGLVIVMIKFNSQPTISDITDDFPVLPTIYNVLRPPKPTLANLEAGYTYPVIKHWVNLFYLPTNRKKRRVDLDTETAAQTASNRKNVEDINARAILRIITIVFVIVAWLGWSLSQILVDMFDDDIHPLTSTYVMGSLLLLLAISVWILIFTRITARYNFGLINTMIIQTHIGFFSVDGATVQVSDITDLNVRPANYWERLFRIQIGDMFADTAGRLRNLPLTNMAYVRHFAAYLVKLRQNMALAEYQREVANAAAAQETPAVLKKLSVSSGADAAALAALMRVNNSLAAEANKLTRESNIWAALQAREAGVSGAEVNRHFWRQGIHPLVDVAEGYGWPSGPPAPTKPAHRIRSLRIPQQRGNFGRR